MTIRLTGLALACSTAAAAQLPDTLDVRTLAIPSDVAVDIRNERLANSELDEFGATLYDRGIVFASARKPPEFLRVLVDEDHGQNFTSLFYAPADKRTRELTGVATFGGRLNHVFHDANPVFSADGETVFFTRSHSKGRRRIEGADGVMYLSIYTSTRGDDGDWSEPTLLPFCTRDSDEMHPTLSPDGRRMYFASSREGGFGETDLYYSDLGGETWGKPVNLGPQVNRPGREAFPFLGADGTLYFASDAAGGLGGFDLYRTAANGRGGYDVPATLGEPYNSEADDTGYVTADGGLTGYFTSARPGGMGGDDLYGFVAEPAPSQAPSGTILAHLAGVPDSMIEGAALELTATGMPIIPDSARAQRLKLFTDARGAVSLGLGRGLEYDFVATRPGFEDAIGSLVVDPATFEARVAMVGMPTRPDSAAAAADSSTLALETDDLVAGSIVELPNIFYDFDDAAIRDDARADLDSLVAVMARYPSLVIELRAHTDSRGAVSYNRDLSARRAESARAYLVSAGVAEARATAVGFGEALPRIACDAGRRCSGADHQLNRRTEIRVVSVDEAASLELIETVTPEGEDVGR